MKQRLCMLSIMIATILQVVAIDNSRDIQSEGSLTPYPVPVRSYDYPDSLTPIYINHIGRHGSRFPASGSFAKVVKEYLIEADSLSTITPLGRKFLGVVNEIISRTAGRWGKLDSLGMAEQRGIARRMYANFPSLFKSGNIEAISTYSPRAVMSMYSFTHELTSLSTGINITASEGKRYSPVLRFFDTDTAYMEYLRRGAWREVYADFYNQNVPVEPMRRLLGNGFKISDDNLRELSLYEYYLIAGMSAMQMPFDYTPYMSLDEYRSCWSAFNLRQYLQRSASVVSNLPIESAKALLDDIINSAETVLNGNKEERVVANLRFAHAETLMPLFALMALDGCYYLTHYYDTVQQHWNDGYVVPMASNLQLIYFSSPSGEIYVRGDLNETPIPMIPTRSEELYVKWADLRNFWYSLSL